MKAHRARKRFGQHFLRDPAVIDAILTAIGPCGEDVIVEIGPGDGAMTRPLASRCGHLHAIELDRDLAGRLQAEFAADEHVSIHVADALRFDFTALGSSLRVTGNLPYNISTPLLFHLLDHRRAIDDMHFMLQKEVVDRMAAEPGSKAFGRLTIALGCFFETEALFDVDRLAFDPPPEVTSAVVRLRPLPPERVFVNDLTVLSSLAAAAFSRRRKTMRNALAGVVEPEVLDGLGIDRRVRPEDVPVSDWIRLANAVGTIPDNARRSR